MEEIIKMRADVDETENVQTREKISETPNWYLKRSIKWYISS